MKKSDFSLHCKKTNTVRYNRLFVFLREAGFVRMEFVVQSVWLILIVRTMNTVTLLRVSARRVAGNYYSVPIKWIKYFLHN